ncbi:MAG TPA: heat-inducible transcriptional repressor HrcA, partial [Chloroflexota bacterium]|nr:heat-inducible transcriptional repressor HrcA [Chloroflexota bacterium]
PPFERPLSERQERILKAIVEDYIRSAAPVASEALVREHGLGVSSATVRNEMAELETDGYIFQPHTSAGRIPSERGYRYFVQRLMEQQQIPRAEQMTMRHQFHQVALAREQWLQLAATVLSRSVHAAAIVSSPKTRESRVKHFEALLMQDGLGLLVLVLMDGTVKQQLVQFPDVTAQEDLSTASNRLNALFGGKTRREVATLDGPFSANEDLVQRAVLTLMAQIDASESVNVYHDGLVELLDQPEFARLERARAIVELLERPQTLRELLPGVQALEGIQILIGSDNRWEWMKECAFVLARYGAAGDVTGVVGVIGPLRLSYSVAVPAVRQIAQIMTELLGETTS